MSTNRLVLTGLLSVIVAMAAGCGGDDEAADPDGGVQFKFCNTLNLNDEDVVAYYDVDGGGVKERLTANTQKCSACVSVEAGATIEFEFGIGSDVLSSGSWKTEADTHYLVGSEVDSDGAPTTAVYALTDAERDEGVHCSNVDPFE